MKAGRAAAAALFLIALFISSDSLAEPPPVAAQAAWEALTPAPLNSTFAAEPETLSRDLRDSAGERTGAPPAWQVTRGQVLRDRGSPTDEFASLENGAELTSSVFTLDPDTKHLSLLQRFDAIPSENDLKVYVLSGDDFDDTTEVNVEACSCATAWERAWVDVSDWAGENIKLKFVQAAGSARIGIDDVATNLLEAKIGRHRSSVAVADPVDTSTGNFNLTRTDISVPTKGVPLAFTRHYNANSTFNGSLGLGWTHTYTFATADGPGSDVEVRYPDGKSAVFDWVSPNFVAPDGNFDTLTCTGGWNGTCTLTSKGQTVYSFSGGKLASIADRNGNTTTVTWNGSRLQTVTAPDGRTLSFTTQTSGRITDISAPLSRSVSYAYVSTDNLSTVTDVEDGVTTYTWDASFVRVTKETDPLNHAVFTNVYDTSGRVQEQKDAVNNITCFYYTGTTSTTNCSSQTVSAGQTKVKDPRGNFTTYSFDSDFRTT
jgi:YD repeat-containing protein